MNDLDEHRRHSRRLEDALERLLALHRQVYDLQGQIVALSQSDAADKVDRVEALKKKVRNMQPEVERAKQALASREKG